MRCHISKIPFQALSQVAPVQQQRGMAVVRKVTRAGRARKRNRASPNTNGNDKVLRYYL